MSALLLTLPLGKYFGFDEIWDDATAVEGLRQVGEAGQACYWIHHKVAAPLRIAAPEGCTTCRQACTRGLAEWDEECASSARHTEAYCSSLSWNGTNPGPAEDDDEPRGRSLAPTKNHLALAAPSLRPHKKSQTGPWYSS